MYCPSCGVVMKEKRSLRNVIGLTEDTWSALWIIAFIGGVLIAITSILCVAVNYDSESRRQHIQTLAQQGILVQQEVIKPQGGYPTTVDKYVVKEETRQK